VRRAFDDLELFLDAKHVQCLAVELENLRIGTTDDEQRRRGNLGQGGRGEIRPATARDDGANDVGPVRGRDERRGGTRAGAKEPDGKTRGSQVGRRSDRRGPVDRGGEALGEQADVNLSSAV
jgi:hypothetical protein